MKRLSIYVVLVQGLLVVLVFSLITISCATTVEYKLPDVVSTNKGKVSGSKIAGSSIVVFKGIPFAAPPVGKLRWKPPQPPEPWIGVRACDAFGPNAIQSPGEPFLCWSSEFIVDVSDTSAGYSEDCLSLNIWTDGAAATGNRPVIVFIHGGGFTSGGSSCEVYDGKSLAEKGVVFVSVNYRVGILGFLTHPGLSAESEHGVSGNYGLLDQIAALKWVRDNIKAFGGDPNNVTIQGQSAGAGSVHALIASPLAKGLFNRAVTQSYNFINREQVTLEKKIKTDLEQTQGRSLAELRNMSTDELLKLNYKNAYYCIDGWVLPANFKETYKSGQIKDISLITGMTADDIMLFRFFRNPEFGPPQSITVDEYEQLIKDTFNNHADKVLNLYPATTSDECVAQYNEISRDNNNFLQCELARLRSFEGNTTYLYYFTRIMPGPESDKWGAFHSADLAYFFNYFTPHRKGYWEKMDYELGEVMSSFLANFAKDGNPNGEDLPYWNVYEEKSPEFIELGDEVKGYSLSPEKLTFWRDYYNL